MPLQVSAYMLLTGLSVAALCGRVLPSNWRVRLLAAAAWDGESAAQGSCPLGEAGIECRQQLLL